MCETYKKKVCKNPKLHTTGTSIKHSSDQIFLPKLVIDSQIAIESTIHTILIQNYFESIYYAQIQYNKEYRRKDFFFTI